MLLRRSGRGEHCERWLCRAPIVSGECEGWLFDFACHGVDGEGRSFARPLICSLRASVASSSQAACLTMLQRSRRGSKAPAPVCAAM